MRAKKNWKLLHEGDGWVIYERPRSFLLNFGLDGQLTLVYSSRMDIERVKAWLKANGVTQKELAEKLGVSEISVSSWMKGKRNMSATSQLALELLMTGGMKDGEQTDEPTQDWLTEFDDDVWGRLCYQADKNGVTPKVMAERLAIRLAEALATSWVQSHLACAEQREQEQAKTILPPISRSYGDEEMKPFA